jgi:hypothetical protein
LNLILFFSLSYSLALDFQKVIALFAIPPIFHKNIIATIKNKTKAIIVGNISDQNCSEVLSLTLIKVFISGFFKPRSFNESLFGKITISLGIFSIPLSYTTSQEAVAIALFQSINISLYFQFLKFLSNWFNQISLSLYCCTSLNKGSKLANIKDIIIIAIQDFCGCLLFCSFGFIFFLILILFLFLFIN